MPQRINKKAQAAVEFSLLAPFLFLFFMCLVQLFYFAYASFSLQRTAFAIAREAAASDDPASYNPAFQLVYCLSPLAQLNHQTMATVLATRCEINTDGNRVEVNLTYPMPIWIPGLGRIFGKNIPLNPSLVSDPALLQTVFQFLGKPIPELSLPNSPLSSVYPISYSTTAFDENSLNPGP